MKAFYGLVTAKMVLDNGVLVSATPFMLTAIDLETGREMGFEFAYKEFPDRNGYGNHSVTISPVSDEIIDFIVSSNATHHAPLSGSERSEH